MDETALVADLVFGGTVVIGAAVLFIMMVLLVAMTLLAGVAGSVMSLARRVRRLLLRRAERQTPVEEAASPHERSAAVVAKADAILAALRAETKAAAATGTKIIHARATSQWSSIRRSAGDSPRAGRSPRPLPTSSWPEGMPSRSGA